jgi:class 3 adenylate cyclase
VRIGVATGLVVVAVLVGSGEARERGVVGETPNLAARLQRIVDSNTVVIEARTGAAMPLGVLRPELLQLEETTQKPSSGDDGGKMGDLLFHSWRIKI